MSKGFKRGEANVHKQQQRKIADLEAGLQRFIENKNLTVFTHRFLENLGTVLALTPYDDWPQMAKTAFEYTARTAPTSAHLYKNRLPNAAD